MKTFKRNRQVQAPDQRVRSIAEAVFEYLEQIGFKHYGFIGKTHVYSKPICETIHNSLFILQDGRKMSIWQGIRKGLAINARKLHDCNAYNLEDTIGLLAERNYL